MPLLNIIDSSNKGRVAIWQLTESVHELLQLVNLPREENEILKNFKLEKRKKEWLCSRILLQTLLEAYPQVSYKASGKPYLCNSDQHISISHCNGFVAVSVSANNTALDIETCSIRVEKVAKRFINSEEELFIDHTKQLEYYTLLWTIKECMYKYFDIAGVDFKNEFSVEPFVLVEKGTIKSGFKQNGAIKSLDLEYIFTPEYILSYH